MNEKNKALFDKRNALYGPTIVKALEKRHFEAYYVQTSEEAVEKAVSLIPKDNVIGFGGSMTLKETGLLKRLEEEGYTMLDREKAKTPEERTEILKKCLTCDTFLMSANAITEDGQLLNVDGIGNRVAALAFGPDEVIVLAGMNKIVRNIEEAHMRIKTTAAPINAMRFEERITPCSITGECADCIAQTSLCAQVVTTRICRPAKRIKVILIGEDLGF